jgi:hypothetical protein
VRRAAVYLLLLALDHHGLSCLAGPKLLRGGLLVPASQFSIGRSYRQLKSTLVIPSGPYGKSSLCVNREATTQNVGPYPRLALPNQVAHSRSRPMINVAADNNRSVLCFVARDGILTGLRG